MPGAAQIQGFIWDEQVFMGGPATGGHPTNNEYYHSSGDDAVPTAELKHFIETIFARLSVDGGTLALFFDMHKESGKSARPKSPLGNSIGSLLTTFHRVAKDWESFEDWEGRVQPANTMSKDSRKSAPNPRRAATFSLAELGTVKDIVKEWAKFTDLGSPEAVHDWILSIGISTPVRDRYDCPQWLLLACIGHATGRLWVATSGTLPHKDVRIALQRAVQEGHLFADDRFPVDRETRMRPAKALASTSSSRVNLLKAFRVIYSEPTADFDRLKAEILRLKGPAATAKDSEKNVLTRIAYTMCPLTNFIERDNLAQAFYEWASAATVEVKTMMFEWTSHQELLLVKSAVELGMSEYAMIASSLARYDIHPSSASCQKRLSVIMAQTGIPVLCRLRRSAPRWWSHMGLGVDSECAGKLKNMLVAMDERVQGGSAIEYNGIDDEMKAEDTSSLVFPEEFIDSEAALSAYMTSGHVESISWNVALTYRQTFDAICKRAFARITASSSSDDNVV